MKSVLHKVAAMVIVLLGIGVITFLGGHASSNDYIEYWSAGRLFIHGANPYSGPLILALEKSRGFTPDAPLIMLNPPWALLLVAPLGYLPSAVGLFVWIAATAGCIAASLHLLNVSPQQRTLAFLFTPIIACFSMQQSSPFLLLGFSLFLRYQRDRPWVAGASLFLMTIKPHLFLVFWVLLLLDCLYRRRFAILMGLALAFVIAAGVVTLITPYVWSDYVALIRGSALDQNNFPTLPTMLRSAINVKMAWIALIPSFLAIVWGIFYYWKRRNDWDWRTNGMPVMLATLLTSPYGWISDEVVLLPAVVHACTSVMRKRSIELLIALNFVTLLAFCVDFRLCAWMPLAWCMWYLYSDRSGEHGNSEMATSEFHRMSFPPES